MHRESQGEGRYCSRDCQHKARRDRSSNTCQECGDEFVVRDCEEDRKFCSKDCAYNNRREARHSIECTYCEEEFVARSGTDREYCSKRCAIIDRTGKYTDHGHSTCVFCGSSFRESSGQANRFCSRQCFHAWRSENISGDSHWQYSSIEKICEECGDAYTVQPARVERSRFCTRECLNKANSGEGAFNWKGGHANYYGENWHRMRRVVRTRDCFRCRKCGMHEDECETGLHVHHIVPLREFDEPEEANTPSNLVTVCPSCHGEVEGDVEAGRALL